MGVNVAVAVGIGEGVGVGANVGIGVCAGVGEGAVVGVAVGVAVDVGALACVAVIVREWVPADSVVLLVAFMSILRSLSVILSEMFDGTVPTSQVTVISSVSDSTCNSHCTVSAGAR